MANNALFARTLSVKLIKETPKLPGVFPNWPKMARIETWTSGYLQASFFAYKTMAAMREPEEAMRIC